jgi:hypothetical protein
MKLVELGARSMDFVDLEFSELGCLAEKKWSGAIFVNLELRGALPNTPLIVHEFITSPLWSASLQASWLNQSEIYTQR